MTAPLRRGRVATGPVPAVDETEAAGPADAAADTEPGVVALWRPIDRIGPVPTDLPADLALEIWTPSLRRRVPAGVAPRWRFTLWWAFHHLGIFRSGRYRIVLVRDGAGTVVHRTCVFPRWWRFGMVGRHEVQFGDIETEPRWRGHGVATTALNVALRSAASTGATAGWYLVASDNAASVRLAERAGFAQRGTAERPTHHLGRYAVRSSDRLSPRGMPR